ncbi:hypothetical protein GDO86_000503 [Hymenochirus boettgeri]|uniref:DNA damage-inducible transcript 3 protein n=1 Tax=Hymenochirus boettgeri TaxID=247094 RepID=A0A8T2KEA0_9PIPI|nr:hypothetical protein GDO86_000503 [Hymenochirus boettgeri]
MMAESLPFCNTMGPLSGWELEAWYEDLQDILWPEIKAAECLQSGSFEQELVQVETVEHSSYFWTEESPMPVDMGNEDVAFEISDQHLPVLENSVQHLSADVLELLNSEIRDSCNVSSYSPVTDTQVGASELDSYSSSSSVHTHTEDEDPCTSRTASKRKRTSQSRGGKVRVKEKEQENEDQVTQLLLENERLKVEIDRLTNEVAQTRKELIERMVNLKKD